MKYIKLFEAFESGKLSKTLGYISNDGKKFLLNRASIIPQIDEVDSMQIIEITDVDNESTETIQYIDS